MLLQQLRMASAVRAVVGGGGGGVTSPQGAPAARRPRSGKPLMLPTPTAAADGAAADAGSDAPPLNSLMAGMPYGVSDSEGEGPASPFHTASRTTAAAVGARTAGGADKVPAAVAVVAAATGARPLGPIATAGLAAEAEAAAVAREAGPRPPSGVAAGVWAEAMATPQPKRRPPSGHG